MSKLAAPLLRRSLASTVVVVAALAVATPASADFFTDIADGVVSGWDQVRRIGESAIGTLTGSVKSAGQLVGNLVVDSAGTPLAFEVVRGVRPMVRATANTAGVVVSGTASLARISYTQGLNGATNIGEVTIDGAGNVAGTVANGVVDGVEYAYENGSIIVSNLAGLDCATIAGLGGNSSYDLQNMEGAAADCGARIGLGFACALPSSIFDLIESSDAMYGEILAGASTSPCSSVPIPPANLVCGAQNRLRLQVQHLAQCVVDVKARLPQNEARFDGAVCKSIGEMLFAVLLDVATDGANTRSVVAKLALGIKRVFDLQQDVSTISGMIDMVCPTIAADVGVGPAPAREITLFADASFRGSSTVISANTPVMPGGFDEVVSSINLPAGTTIAVFSDPYYQGTCDTISAPLASLAAGNTGGDRVSSVRINEVCPGPPRIELYDNANYGGRFVQLGTDNADLASAWFAGNVSSVKVLGAATAALYSDANYRGACITVRGGVPSLDAAGFRNDTVRSVRLDSVCPAVKATLFADASFRGTQWSVTNDIADNRRLGSDNASSLRLVPGNGPVAIYKGLNFTGQCKTLSGDTASFGDGFGDNIASIRFNATCNSRPSYAVDSRPAAWVSSGNRCMGGGAANDSTVSAQLCDGNPMQMWRTEGPYIKDGLDRCLVVAPQDLARNGALASVHVCDGGEYERWSIRGGRFVDLAGRCLEVPAGGLFGDDVALVVGPCDGGLNQRFVRVGAARVDRPAEAPPGAVLDCGMDVIGASGPTCRSSAELLELAALPGERFLNDSDTVPMQRTLSASDAARAAGGRVPTALTLPDRIAHDPQDGSFTASIWFRPWSLAGRQILLAKGSSVLGYSLTMSGGKLVWQVADGAGHAAAITSSNVPNDQWSHVVVSIDRANGRLRGWLNGSSAGFTEGGEGAASASIAEMGGIASTTGLSVRGAGTVAWLGELDALRLYARALDEDDVAMLRSAEPPTNLARSPAARVRLSTTFGGAVATRAIDGLRDGSWATGGVTHTEGVAGSWFELNLGSPTSVRRVDLYNRVDCCGERLANATVALSTTPCDAPSAPVATRNTGMDTASTYRIGFQTDPMAQYVCVRTTGIQPVSIGEIEVYGPPPPPAMRLANLAREPGASVRQSTIAWDGVPERGVDGDRNPDWGGYSVTHTDLAPDSWYEVNLGRPSIVSTVDLYNRADCCSERLEGAKVQIADMPCDAPGFQPSFEMTVPSPPPPRFRVAAAEGVRGAFVCVRQNGIISLAEIEVMGFLPLPLVAWPANYNLARAPSATARMSSYSAPYPTSAARVVEGWRSGNWWLAAVAGTDALARQWLELDLGRLAPIGAIHLYNRTDCCTTVMDGLTVEVANRPCDAADYVAVASRPLPARSPPVTQLDFTGTSARFVCLRQNSTNGGVTVAEVEVYSPR